MYIPRAFAETRESELLALLHAYPFASLVTTTAEGILANHLPMLMLDGKLCGHMARCNALRACDGAAALAMFQGPQGYISPNWYPSKAVTHRDVPTWNYQVVHVHGRLRIVDDKIWLRQLLDTLTAKHEANQPRPWHLDEAPADHLDHLLDAIVGVALEIDRVEGKFKLSQNQPQANRDGVVEGLGRRNALGDTELARAMCAWNVAPP